MAFLKYFHYDVSAAKGEGEELTTRYFEAGGDMSVKERRALVGAIGGLGDKRALEVLENAATDADEGVRVNAAIALRRYPVDDVGDAISVALADDARAVRIAALQAVDSIGSRKLALRVIPSLESNDHVTREAAMKIVAKFSLVEARAVAEKLLSDPKGGVRWRAAEALAEIGDKNSYALIAARVPKERFPIRRVMEVNREALANRLELDSQPPN